MKPSRLLLWFCLAGLALAALLVWFANRSNRMTTPTSSKPPKQQAQPGVEPVRATEGTPTVSNVGDQAPAAPPDAPRKSKEQLMAEILSTENDVPIVFYGKLEDQFGNPVAGAQVAGNTTIYNGQRAGAEHVSTVSDGNGYFQISAGKGESLGVMPRKQGYALATGDTEFKYSHLYPGHFVPDPSNPVVIKLWKLQGAEPLLTIDQRYKLQCTPDPFNVDLVAGAIVPEGGDLRITINRPSGVISERSPQDWGFTVEARDGGLMESRGQGSVTFWAPEEGYQTSDTLSALSNRHGLGLIQQDLFIKSRNGKVYSKVFVSFKINEEPDGLMSVSFRGVANTNSSRNWEATAPQ